MVFPIIGAALGGLQLISGLSAQRSQARAQEESLQAQADSVKTQEHLTKLQVSQQRRLSESNQRLELQTLQGQRSIGLLQLDAEEQQAQINELQQRVQLDQKRFRDEQSATLAQTQALLQQTNELAQLEQLSRQSLQQTNEVAGVLDQRQLREGARGEATVGADSDLNALEREALILGDLVQGSTQQVGQGIASAEDQAEYEQGLALQLLELANLQSGEFEDSLDRASEADRLQLEGGRTDIDLQSARNIAALENAYLTEEAKLDLATSSADVQSAAQNNAISAQSRGIQRPGGLGLISALGNTALGFYDAFGSMRQNQPLRPPTPPSGSGATFANPVPTSSASPSTAALGLVPGASRTSVPIQVIPAPPSTPPTPAVRAGLGLVPIQ